MKPTTESYWRGSRAVKGWTQDPLRKASQVQILPSPPTFSPITGISFDTSYNKPLEQLIFQVMGIKLYSIASSVMLQR